MYYLNKKQKKGLRLFRRTGTPAVVVSPINDGRTTNSKQETRIVVYNGNDSVPRQDSNTTNEAVGINTTHETIIIDCNNTTAIVGKNVVGQGNQDGQYDSTITNRNDVVNNISNSEYQIPVKARKAGHIQLKQTYKPRKKQTKIEETEYQKKHDACITLVVKASYEAKIRLEELGKPQP
jgi:hypothetical protein